MNILNCVLGEPSKAKLDESDYDHSQYQTFHTLTEMEISQELLYLLDCHWTLCRHSWSPEDKS